MIDLDGGATLGMMILSDIDWKNRSANIGTKINIAERDRLHGDLNNAQYAVIKYAFEELGLNRIECSILDYNTFSKRLVKNLGFVKEGVCRSKIFKRDSWHDVEIYSMIKSDFVHYRDGVAPWQIKD
jgi:RimJ/RimL family protein N-acetyltransferase